MHPKDGHKIDQHEIDAIKQGVDLVPFMKACGIELKRIGSNYRGFCPFHEDTLPSLTVNPRHNLWNCFGCDKGGDNIRFVQLFDKISFNEAVERLKGYFPDGKLPKTGKTRKPVKKDPGPAVPEPEDHKPLTPAHIKVLARVIDFYHAAFCEDARGREYLEGRGLSDTKLFADHAIGIATGTLLNVLPEEGDIKEQLQEIGVLNDKGKEHFYGCITFPLYDLAGNPTGIYGRRIMGKGADHLYLPGTRRGIFNRQAAKASKEIILTEAVIDAATLINAGIVGAIPCYGVNGLTDDHISLFKQHNTELIRVCFDNDESGKRGREAVVTRLQEEGFTVETITLSEQKDINEFFYLTANAKEQFEKLLTSDTDAVNQQAVKEERENKDPSLAEREGSTTTADGITCACEKRQYEVRAISKTGNKLKATVKGFESKGNRFHVDTVDFYSARSRSYLVRGLAELFGVEEKIIGRDMEKLTLLTEEYTMQSAADTGTPTEIPAQEKEEAMRFLMNPDLLTEIVADIETVGYTGEEMNKLLCYLAAVSRKMDEPLSVMIQSRSAAGKSCLQDAILALIPDEDFIKYTRLTDQALFYRNGSLAHKILAIEELDGMNGALYSIRTIQSAKKITIAYTGKDPVTGKMQTEENSVEGPLMVFITTTQAEIDGETASRFMFISIDESREMTEKILARQRQAHTLQGFLGKLKGVDIIRKHHNANRLLQPLKVVNPYAELLTFTAKSLRARRDNTKYLGLIQAIAYLFQYQRKKHQVDYGGKAVEYINVTLTDIDQANRLAAEVLGRSLDELSPPSRKLLTLIREMTEQQAEEGDKEKNFTRRDIREYSSWSDFQVKTHIRQLEELEYIYSLTGKKGKEYVYELLYTGGGEDGKPFVIGLTEVTQLKEKAAAMGIVDDSGT
jgi:DNA primase catalytic core